MKHRDVAVILATGGMGLVRAAYSSGKPAYGVGPGNAPCYVERSADLRKAASDIMTGKTFDNGVLCSSPNSVVVDEAVSEELRREFQALGAYFMNQAEMEALATGLVTPQRLPNPALVGKPAIYIAQQVGIKVPDATTRADRAADRRWPRLSPFHREAGSDPLLVRREGLARGLRAVYPDPPVWRHGAYHVDPFEKRGGHSSIRLEKTGVPHLRQHADDPWIDRPDNRPGPGDDPRVRRLGREYHVGQHHAEAPAEHQAPGVRGSAGNHNRPDATTGGSRPERPALPKAPRRPMPTGIPVDALAARIDRFLASRGYGAGGFRPRCSGTDRLRSARGGSARSSRSRSQPCRFRLRGRRQGGAEGGAEAGRRREDHHYPRGAGPGRVRESVRPGGLATLISAGQRPITVVHTPACSKTVIAEPAGLIVDPSGRVLPDAETAPRPVRGNLRLRVVFSGLRRPRAFTVTTPSPAPVAVAAPVPAAPAPQPEPDPVVDLIAFVHAPFRDGPA